MSGDLWLGGGHVWGLMATRWLHVARWWPWLGTYDYEMAISIDVRQYVGYV